MAPIPKPKRQRQRHFIKQWRINANLTQQRAADRIGMSRENYGRIENGKVPYDQDFLEEAAKAFNCSPADLIMRDPSAPNAPWSIWETLKPDQQEEALDFIRFIQSRGKKANDDKAA
ncbi:helix-turn-helix domain-containing protein [Ancylobacter pratisalsi]|nr:helix-turn-helix transcriptional regulator [Ancylobacter pratisalsi]